MDTSKLKKYAQHARRQLREQVGARMDLVLDAGSAARRENPGAVKELEKQLKDASREQLVEKVAYTWFNRFCALRFMDLNGYTRIRVVSPADEGQFQPEILAEAKAGHIDPERIPEAIRQRVQALLGGQASSHDPQQEAYRLLVVAECNRFHQAMPYLFERIADYTELLMPDDLLSGNAILADTREAMAPDACKDVEVIGWLYQFYISEKKDQVFEGLKKNQKITPENIPAATQLFTPHWIVRYLVDNSLGRLWMLNHPDSKLIEKMAYYIKPEQPEADYLKIAKPEDIKICDPACGSGHMLTYAFDLLYAIYEEVGIDASEIPKKILTHNLYGIELDERAGELAAFALTMKARAKQRSFFRKAIKPNVCVLENVSFETQELNDYIAEVGRDLFTLTLRETLMQFAEADNFGSLIQPALTQVRDVLPLLEAKKIDGNLFLANTHDKVLKVLRMADYLSPRYQVVVANPPYMGRRNGMNSQLKEFIKIQYEHCKADLYAAFLQRSFDLVMHLGYPALVTMQSWMFLSSYKGIRQKIVGDFTITSLAQLGARAFPEIGGEVVQVAATAMRKADAEDYAPTFIRLIDYSSDDKPVEFHAQRNWYIGMKQSVFLSIPDSPITYWLPKSLLVMLTEGLTLEHYSDQRQGLATGEDERFLRLWHEVESELINWSPTTLPDDSRPWFQFLKGGSFRKWFGNNEYCIHLDSESFMTLSKQGNALPSRQYYLRESLVWSDITSRAFGARYNSAGKVFATGALSAFPKKASDTYYILGFLNCSVHNLVMSALSSGIHYSVGYVDKSPMLYNTDLVSSITRISKSAIDIASEDWNHYETSWSFTESPLIDLKYRQTSLNGTYRNLRAHWQTVVTQTQRLELENNRIFIDAYGLQDELTPEVPLTEITLTCNPHYRYGGDKTDAELESLLLADTMREFLSYAVGCMFGRYSLDKPGLVLANQGETLADYLRQVPEPRFMPDEDNVIPLLDGEWFPDDVTERFRQFLRVTFGAEHYAENLAFIEKALGKDVRKYFLKDFYADHVKRYKKRPIYWLFASPKGTFSALVSLHRYRPDTVSVVLQYLRDFRKKLAARLEHLQQVQVSASASQGEKTKAGKEADTIRKQQVELDDYERDTLYPLATEQVELDLDDGVKVNYLKLGDALKTIPGLAGKES